MWRTRQLLWNRLREYTCHSSQGALIILNNEDLVKGAEQFKQIKEPNGKNNSFTASLSFKIHAFGMYKITTKHCWGGKLRPRKSGCLHNRLLILLKSNNINGTGLLTASAVAFTWIKTFSHFLQDLNTESNKENDSVFQFVQYSKDAFLRWKSRSTMNE